MRYVVEPKCCPHEPERPTGFSGYCVRDQEIGARFTLVMLEPMADDAVTIAAQKTAHEALAAALNFGLDCGYVEQGTERGARHADQ